MNAHAAQSAQSTATPSSSTPVPSILRQDNPINDPFSSLVHVPDSGSQSTVQPAASADTSPAAPADTSSTAPAADPSAGNPLPTPATIFKLTRKYKYKSRRNQNREYIPCFLFLLSLFKY